MMRRCAIAIRQIVARRSSRRSSGMNWVILVSLLTLTTPGTGNVETYEANVLPEHAGWERVGSFDADRWNDDGWFFQYVELGIWDPPPIGETDIYRRSIAEFAGEQRFFIEWRCETDVPSSILEVSGVAAALAAGGHGSIAFYHTSMTDARIQLFRDTSIPLVYVDILPSIPHTYRVELYADQFYEWYVDGQRVDFGVPQGTYPNSDSELIWGARHYLFDNTMRWDYVRYGEIPVDGSGDFDSDDSVDLGDFYFFHECLTNRRLGINGGPESDAAPGCRFADFDDDTDVDLRDVADFQNTFTSGD